MSWIVFLFLIGYGSIRAALWLRGQLRFLILRRQLPSAPEPLALPAHLTLGLRRLVEGSHDARVRLVTCIRAIGTVLITDPDVPLGCVRDYRYRVAVLSGWSASRTCLRIFESLDDSDRLRLEAVGVAVETFRDAMERLDPRIQEAKRARPLEAFAVEHVRSARTGFEALLHELEKLEGRLGASPHDPYRA
ncbi:MAG: hypothetical protein R3B09_27965 [Nannocystaceae bacterium]